MGLKTNEFVKNVFLKWPKTPSRCIFIIYIEKHKQISSDILEIFDFKQEI